MAVKATPVPAPPQGRLAEEFVPDPMAVAMLDEHTARRHRVVPVALQGDTNRLLLWTSDAFDRLSRELVQRALTRPLGLDCISVATEAVAACLDRCYRHPLAIDEILREISEPDARAGTALRMPWGEPVVRLVDAVLREAVTLAATDIHLSPQREAVALRYRIDGVLHAARLLPQRCWSALRVRLKVIAELDIAESRRPQDGHISRFISGRRVDFRLASFPLVSGENLVLRVLDRQVGLRTLADLELAAAQRTTLRTLVQRPEGLIVVVGPTGCGKSTTLYALLGERLNQGLNIMTLEDPVEYPLDPVCQTSIDPARNLGFAQGVRSLLRQDPDVLLIGEVRDCDSCEMVLRAATSGHQVFTTLHASDSVSALLRLIGLGAAPMALATTLHAVVAQRLLRMRCPDCQSHDAVTGLHGASPPADIDKPCRRCQGCGYQGRRACLEILKVTPALARAIVELATEEQIRSLARAEGLVTLREQAEHWVRQGHTARSEVDRVLGPEEFVQHQHRTGSVHHAEAHLYGD